MMPRLQQCTLEAGHTPAARGLASLIALLLLLLSLSLALEAQRAEASALLANPSSAGHSQTFTSASGDGDYANLDNLISDFLDDAGNRLKKSKLNSMRQIKPTLRFGRRSDPLMAPNAADYLAAAYPAYESSDELSQQRILAALLAKNN